MREEISEDFYAWLVDLRRRFHQIPEPAYREIKTAALICRTLDEMKVPYQQGIGGTGILARLTADRGGRTAAFRADMDALPLEEVADIPYRSRHPGYMHACGHDGHVTISLGVIRRLIDSEWPRKEAGELLFIFQPAEEGGAGAKAMLETGLLDSYPVGAVFAGHLHPEIAAGSVGIANGTCNAASDTIRVDIRGKGGHGAQPQQCRDPIVAGASLVTQLQTLVSREVHPLESAVISICRFAAGTASNIIPEEAMLEGTLRTLSPESREALKRRIGGMTKGVELSFGVSAALTFTEGYPPLINDPTLFAQTESLARELLGSERVEIEKPRMGAEDFSYFCQKWPGMMVGIGCHDPAKGFEHGLHSPHFDMDERALAVGTVLFSNLLSRWLRSG
jgi:amidohydrolase